MLASKVKEAKLISHKPCRKAVMASLSLFSGHSFRISLWKGASEGNVLAYQDTKLQGTTYTPVCAAEKEMIVWAGYQEYFPQGCLVLLLISWESRPGCNPGHTKVDIEVASVACTTGDKCLMVSGCPSRKAQRFSRARLATENPTWSLHLL